MNQDWMRDRDLMLDVAAGLTHDAIELTKQHRSAYEAEIMRRRAAMKLVPVPKLGFEHLYLSAEALSGHVCLPSEVGAEQET